MLTDSQWLGLINKMLWVFAAVAAEILITYPPTKIIVNIRHKGSLRLIGVGFIAYQFLLAISLKSAQVIPRDELAWLLRILEFSVVTGLIAWSYINIKEKITLR